jgi:hypothetical protein
MSEVERSGVAGGAATRLPFGREVARGAWMVAGLDAEAPGRLEDGGAGLEAWRARTLVAPDGLVWDGLTDVVVVGSGVAGLVAALTAREGGVDVIVVAGPDVGRRVPEEALALEVPDGHATALDGPAVVLPTHGQNGLSDALALGRLGLRVEGLNGGDPGPWATPNGGRAGAGLDGDLDGDAYDLGWQAGVVDGLVVAGRGGPVLGVRLDGGGPPRYIRALRGVILTSTRAALDGLAKDDDDGAGDGLLLGLAAGGAVADGLSATVGCPVAVIGTNDEVNGLWVNLAGERFIAEDAHHTTAMRAIERQPGGMAWAIFDADTAMLGGEVLGALAGGFSRDLEVELALGLIARAPTWEALAMNLGVDPDGLTRTVAGWNDDVALHGRDRCFGRQVALRALGARPVFGQRVTPVRLEAGGGLRVNTEAQVLDDRQSPIPGLYAAGSAAAAFIGTWYPRGGPRLAGLVLGRRAGAHAAGDLGANHHEVLARGLR